ncbi:MAG: protein-export chaperone SecB [Proteobacteria bacterium]|nr:protein-export chaperone SecB [Pseudomonadota bacterium]
MAKQKSTSDTAKGDGENQDSKKPEEETAAASPDGGAGAAAPGQTDPGQAEQETSEPPITINVQYIKDLSFEAPTAPGIFSALQTQQPDITVNINVGANPLQDKVFEVVLEINAECKIEKQIGFILELDYAGVFTLNIPDEHLQAVLLIECPRLIFPFARNILAEVSRDGGFPPLMLGPVDFAAMFQAKLQELEQAAREGEGAPSGPPSDPPADPPASPAK